MDNAGIAVEACQAQTASYSEQSGDNLTNEPQLLQAIHINHDSRSNTEGAHIAKRIHLLAEVTAANAKRTGSTTIHRVKNYCDNDKDRS